MRIDSDRITDTPARRRSKRRTWFILTVLGLGCLLGYGVYSLGRFAIPTGLAVTPTAGTPTPGTPTPIVTHTSEAEPTSSAGAYYLAAAQVALTAWENSATVLVEQGREVQANSGLLNQGTWRDETTAAIDSLELAAASLRALPAPPAGYEAVGAAITELAQASDQLTSDVTAVLAGDLTAIFRLQDDVDDTLAADTAVRDALETAPPG